MGSLWQTLLMVSPLCSAAVIKEGAEEWMPRHPRRQRNCSLCMLSDPVTIGDLWRCPVVSVAAQPRLPSAKGSSYEPKHRFWCIGGR